MYGAVATSQGSGSASSSCDSYGEPWWLMWESCSSLLTQGIALALLWWHFNHEPFESEVGCKGNDVRGFAWYAWFCQGTLAHVEGFPLLAAAVCVAVAQRQLLRKRIYYGLLRRGILLDFRGVERQVDPTLVLLAWCLVCGVLHEIVFYEPEFKKKDHGMKVGIDDVVKVRVGGEDRLLEFDMDDDSKFFLVSFCAPCIVFLIFLYNAHQIEPSLVPLSSYYLENPEEAKRTLNGALVLDELEAAPSAAAALLEDQSLDNVEAVYEVLQRHSSSISSSTASSATSDDSSWFSFRPWAHGLLSVPWPAPLLLQASFDDEPSAGLRQMWRVMSGVCITFVVFICAELLVISWRAWRLAFDEDNNAGFVAGAVVLSLHVVFALRVLQVTCLSCGGSCSCS